jgi:DNA-binding NarL/FixJ family response regulator
MSAPSKSNKKARVLVVDDHPLVCKAMFQLLNRQADMVCCGMVQNATATVSAAIQHQPDLVLLDLKLKDGDGVQLIKLLLKQIPTLRVLVLSQFDEPVFAENSLKAGACGYVTKLETAREILTAIRTVLTGKVYLNHKISASMLDILEVAKPPAVNGHAQLTKREAQVLQMVGVGMKTRNIAAKLNLSNKTIETYREHLKRKLGLKNSTELAHFAICWVERRPPR